MLQKNVQVTSEEGDGEKTFVSWKNDFLSFGSTGHTTYAGADLVSCSLHRLNSY